MSDDELEKLAAEMQNIKPSETARTRGMDAAMAAFDMEFAANDVKEATPESISQKNTKAPQGLEAAPRPTGQSTGIKSAQTFGSSMMTKFNKIFDLKPRTAMLAGSCMAALFASAIYVQTNPFEPMPSAPKDMAGVEDSVEISETTKSVAIVETIVPPVTVETHAGSADIGTMEETPDKVTESPIAVTLPNTEPSKTAETPAISDIKTDTSSNVITIERRVVKIAGSVKERVIPAEYGTIKRRTQTSPERAEWREVPLRPEDAAKGITESFERVVVPHRYQMSAERIVLREAHTELVNIPPVYETIKETIRINADGSTDTLGSEILPPTNADLASIAKHNAALEKANTPVKATAVKTLGDIIIAQEAGQKTVQVPTVGQAGGRINSNTTGQFSVFNGTSNQVVQSTETIVQQTGEILARVMIPAKYKTVTKQVVKTPASTQERVIPAITKDVTVKVKTDDGGFKDVTKTFVIQEARSELVPTPHVYETITERVLIEPAREEWKPGSQAINALPSARQTVSAGGSNDTAKIAALPAAVTAPPPAPIAAPLASAPAPSVSNPRLAVRQTPAPATTLMAEAPAPMLNQKINGYTLDVVPAEFETVTETVVVQEASTELVTVPATYETVTETVVVQPQSVDYVTTPPTYEWIDGEIEGSSIEYETVPAEYETYAETVVVQEASTELVTIPPVYETIMETVVVQPQYVAGDGSIVPAKTKQVARRVIRTPASTQERVIPSVTKTETRRRIKTPASTVERIVPYEKRDGKTRVPVTPARTVERAVPAVTKQVSRRVIKTPARTQVRAAPNVTKQVTRQKIVKPAAFYLRDDDGNVVREFASLDEFEIYKSNLPTSVQEKPVSTFSVDVDTASYSFLRASINSGKLPPRSAIRVEELINYFPYDYEAPKSTDEPFKANVTVTPTPWNADTKLMHIGIKGYVPPADERPRSNIVFLIDTSGSMKAANKLPLLINSFKLLLGTLDADDTVSIVTYAASVGTALEPTSARDKDKIYAALNRLQASGGTAGGAGLQLAYQKAQENFDEEGVNRVILATDGDFNIGFSSPDEMKTFIETKRDTGIFLSVLGFGVGNYKDNIMQSLAQNGNGVAAYIDTLAEANKVLANEAGSALITIAKDVKIQVEFNPATISEYRLIGYETRALKRQDFNNDKVDAGEIGAGHTVTAIYEMTPVGSPAQTVDDLRYVSEGEPVTTGSDEYAFVKIRHKLPNADTSTLQKFPIGPGSERKLRRASQDMRFATAVAAVGQKLRGDTPLNDFSYEEAIKLAKKAKGKDEHGYRAEFIQLVRLIDSLDN